MATLVTGATGFVGLGIVRALAAAGVEVVGFDVRSVTARAAVFLGEHAGRVIFVEGDVRDGDALRRAIRGRGVDAVVHAAALTPPPDVEREQPGEVVSVNIGGTAAVLEAAREARLRRVAYVSSSRVYTVSDPAIPVDEDAPTRMDSLYAISKRTGEALGTRYADLCGMDFVALRPGWIYGPTERPTLARAVMSTVYQMVHLALAGEKIRVDDLRCPRDWTHVEDIGRGVAAAVLAPRLTHRIYNLSAGQNYTAQEVLETLARCVPGTRYREVPAAHANVLMRGENRRGPLDIGRLSADTGFVPRYSLESGLARYVDWCTAVGGGYGDPGPGGGRS